MCLKRCLYCPVMPEPGIVIRECETHDDYRQCIALEREVWGDEDIDIMPVRMYMISRNCGGPTIGAFDEHERLVGVGHLAPALIGKHIAFHSHLLSVKEEFRDREIGYRIKLAQRERATAAGVKMMFWTFDPLQSRNAHFNINKLGVVIRRYGVNYYGQNVSTVFDPDIPSDRVIVEWWLASAHVENTLAGIRPGVDDVRAMVIIPDDIGAIRARSTEEHLRWRLKNREEFQDALGRGLIARGFERNRETAQGSYLFGSDEDQFRF